MYKQCVKVLHTFGQAYSIQSLVYVGKRGSISMKVVCKNVKSYYSRMCFFMDFTTDAYSYL